MARYGFRHTTFHPTESLKRSARVSETELPLEDDVSTVPQTLPASSELDHLVHDPDRNEATITDLNTDISLGHHLASAQEHDHNHNQRQEHLTLLKSLNEQTTSLLTSYCQLDSQNEANRRKGEDNMSLLEQALVMGQIALVLASSVYPGTCASATSKTQKKPHGEIRVVNGQAQVVLALTNIATALVKHCDRTGDKRDFNEAGGLYGRGVDVVGIEKGVREVKVEREYMDIVGEEKGKRQGQGVKQREWKLDGYRNEGEDGEEEGYGPDMVLMLLDRLRELLAERGFAV